MARRWRLTLVILATWEADIRRIMVHGKPSKIVLDTLSPKCPTQTRVGDMA
jgi:hypothetical protein